jgi:hypothetical protein
MSFRSKAQLQGFHMSSLVSCPNTPNKEMISDEGERKEIY